MIKTKYGSVLICFLLLCILTFSISVFSACDNKNSDQTGTEQTGEDQTGIELTLENYSEYFTLQEEVTAYNEETYKKGLGLSEYTKITQSKKYSLLLLKENIKFNNVVLTFENDTYVSGFKSYAWKGNGGKLYVDINGSGFLTLSATYDEGKSDWWLSAHPLRYKISKIEGTIIIKK